MCLKERCECHYQFSLHPIDLFLCHLSRTLRRWSICHPRNSGSTLAAVHLENNRLEADRIPADTFSCLIDAQGLVLYPQQGRSSS